jgi:ABC-type branched-subunit amino acid transport system ATPase component
MTQDRVIVVRELVKKFGGVAALDQLSLSILRESITCVLGPNGSGKTTLFNILSGLTPFDAGIVIINGEERRSLAPYQNRERSIARTFQDVRLFGQMTALENVIIALQERRTFHSLFQFATPILKEHAQYFLSLVDLQEKSSSLAGELSFGQRKLLEVARVLAADTQIVLLDEPFAGMSLARIETIKRLLSELRADAKSIILIDHNMEVVRSLADHVVVLHHGQLLAQGSFDDISRNEAVINAYLGR